MATTSSTTQLQHKRRVQKRRIYGFTFSNDQLVEWGNQHLEEPGDEKHFLRVSKSMGPLFNRYYRLWYRTTTHMVRYYSGPRRGDLDWSLCLADNESPDTATPPPREIIDRIKEALNITQDPEWHLFYGD